MGLTEFCKNHPDVKAKLRSDGVSTGLCEACNSEKGKKMAEGRAIKKRGRQIKPKPSLPAKVRTKPKPKPTVVALDFESYPDLFKIIEKRAREEYRAIDMEILFLLGEKVRHKN
jgi:hypothetical protein